MPTRRLDQSKTNYVPLEYSGKWIAWNADHSRIVASADDLPELWRVVHDQPIEDPIFEKVPRADVRFVGWR